MECAHRNVSRRVADHLGEPVAHLRGSLVRKRHGQDVPWGEPLVLDEPCNAMGDHARLAGAGTGEYEQRPLRRRDGAALCLVEWGEDSLLDARPVGSRVRPWGGSLLRRCGGVGREIHWMILPPSRYREEKRRGAWPCQAPRR